MTSEKLEPRLAQEISAARAAGDDDRPIPVIIEHSEVVFASQGDQRGGMADLEARVKHLQKGIVQQLAEFGAPDIQQSVLANLISTSLRPSQVEAIAAREDVKIIRLNREEQVTC
jgi:hypothetical protein